MQRSNFFLPFFFHTQNPEHIRKEEREGWHSENQIQYSKISALNACTWIIRNMQADSVLRILENKMEAKWYPKISYTDSSLKWQLLEIEKYQN